MTNALLSYTTSGDTTGRRFASELEDPDLAVKLARVLVVVALAELSGSVRVEDDWGHETGLWISEGAIDSPPEP